ncbi:HNH endonuclease signature motif containing protein [Promicromonospora panici]|uniref:HNH endonuclease signature motif containing protein n=1 Tax=Promicromonospora panici TaxID=2219658 RepID=UPI00101C71DC|nr:HNH endonuclease signature motif containing protein [Promicromonospora panici]
MEQSTNNTTPGGLPPAASIEEAVARIKAAVGDLADLTGPEVLDGWDAPSIGRLIEAHTHIRGLTGQLDGVRYTLLPRIEAEGSWRSGGMARAFTTWLRLREGVSSSTADKDLKMARRLATALPLTRQRLVSGDLGVDHARVMVDVAPTSETRTDALGWLIDTRTGDRTTPEQFVQTVAVDFPDPVEDPDGERTRELITAVLEGAVAVGTLATGEGVVLHEAPVLNVEQFRKVAKAFASVTDPDTDEADDDKAAAGEFLDLSKTFGGYHLEGFLTDEHGLLVQTAITAVMGAPAAEDTRTPAQRRAQGLADVARVVLDTNQASPGAAIAPHLNVTVSWKELVTQVTRTREGLCLSCGHTALARGTPAGAAAAGGGTTGTASTASTMAGWGVAGWGTAGAPSLSGLLDCGGPVFTETGSRVPRALLRRLACDSRITRVVFGPDGAVLDVGRAQRTVTGQMRRAVIARDQHCVYPGCDQPPSRCEVHHAVQHWADGGNTSVANSALLCWHHHALVDAKGISMHWAGKPTTDSTGASTLVETGWVFTDAHGHRIRLPDAIDTIDTIDAPPPPTEPTAEPPAAEAA